MTLGNVGAVLRLLTPQERTGYFSLVLGRALTGVLDVLGILLIGALSALAAAAVSGGAPPRVLGMELPVLGGEGLLLMVLAVLGVFLLKAVIAVLLMRAQARFVAAVESRNADRLARHLLAGSVGAMRERSRAEIQFAVIDSTVFAFTGLLNNVAALIAESVLVLVIAVTLIAVDPMVAICTLAYFALVIGGLQLLIGRALSRAGQEAVAGTVSTVATIGDAVAAYRELTVLEQRASFVDRIDRSRRRVATSGASLTFLGGMPRYVVETALMLGVVILVAVLLGTSGLAEGLVIVGVFLTGGVRMMASLIPLQNALGNIKQNSAKAQPALDLLVELPTAAEEDRPVSVSLPPGPLAVALEDVSYRYPGADRAAIDGVTVELPAGKTVALIGPSGAGKTTIADLVLGVLDPERGTVTAGGARPAAIRRAAPGVVAYVPQHPGLVSGTIADNVALGVPADQIDRARVREVLAAAQLEPLIASLPDGLDASVGAHADALSGGQVQRIGIARALYTRPRLLVLDEATSALDAGAEAAVATALRALHGTVTVLVIAHRLSTVQGADMVHVVEGGRVTASGTFAEVRESVPLVQEYVKLMSFNDEDEGES